MEFKGKQRTFYYTQINNGTPDEVFPLLCPVREADWLEGWQYKMIHSDSGVVEQDCVFTTPHKDDLDTVWCVTHHDPKNYLVEFVRTTPNVNVVRIRIELEGLVDNKTKAHISYRYTGLNEEQNRFIENGLEDNFIASMHWWERAINYYLKTGEMLTV